MTLSMLFLGFTACASRTMKIPGPLGPVAEMRPPAANVRNLPPATPEPEKRRRRSGGFGDTVAAAAKHHLKNAPTGFRNDCSGFVMAAYHRAGLDLSGSTKTLWKSAKAQHLTHRKPQLGDIAFFDNTYDRNRNGKRDDPLTHVAIVIEIHQDGTLLLAHAGTSKGRTTLRMNLDQPDDRADDDGTVLNDWLRARRRGDPKNAALLSGQLFKGFASFPPNS